MRLYFLVFSIFTCLITTAFSQQLEGVVYDQQGSPLVGASVYWEREGSGTVTDVNGKFELPLPSQEDQLIVSYIGFQPDTLSDKDLQQRQIKITLKEAVDLKAVEVQANKASTEISLLEPINMEKIGSQELLKAACCNLSESFETNATVDVNFTDAVSGSKKIQMLGLDGIYSQILFENIPNLRGLSASRGLTYIPGTWIESIQITKGSGSVVNGYESMTGQINLEMIKPDDSDRLFVNLYGNQQGRKEANIHLARKLSDKWSTGLLLHGNDLNQKNDHNEDGFLDMPLKTQYNVLNRWKYVSDRYMAQFGVRALTEDNTGGQTIYDPANDRGTRNAFGIGIESREAEVFFKNGLIFPSAPERSLSFISSAKRTEQDFYYGLKDYSGEQNTLYLNLVYQSTIFSHDHLLKMGGSYLLDQYDETFNDSSFSRNESVPGIFTEYIYEKAEKVSLVAGMRADQHNLYGLMISPRMHFKYHVRPLTALRLSAGRGFRTANIYAENAAVFASSRNVIIEEAPEPEISWNGGISLIHKFKLLKKSAYLNVDLFRTEFENQVVVDLENPDEVRFYNLDGHSYSNSLQADLGAELLPRLDAKIAGKIYDVKTTYRGTDKERPLVKRLSGLFNVAYATKFEKWKFDVTGLFYGSSRLPVTSTNPEGYRLDKRSEPYQTFNAQVTRVFKHWQVYLGGENIGNYQQPNAILAAEDPFGPNFDASMIWGPIAGRTIYAGIRIKIQ